MQNPGSVQQIRLLVADGSPIHTQLLAKAIGEDRGIKVVGFTANSVDIANGVIEYRPDILLISANLEGEPNRGFRVLQELQSSHSNLKAVVMLDSSSPDEVVHAFRSGARGVFCRSASLSTLRKCIAVVHRGQIWASSEELGFLIAAFAAAPLVRLIDANGLSVLSPREHDVVRCLAEGSSNREIAQHLGISQNTVKNYMFRIFDKLGVSSRVELLFLLNSKWINNDRANRREAGRWPGSEQVRAEQVPEAGKKAVGSPPEQLGKHLQPHDLERVSDQSTIAARLGST
jgi:DNA-binding NarL/FixJ family response regulator